MTTRSRAVAAAEARGLGALYDALGEDAVLWDADGAVLMPSLRVTARSTVEVEDAFGAGSVATHALYHCRATDLGVVPERDQVLTVGGVAYDITEAAPWTGGEIRLYCRKG